MSPNRYLALPTVFLLVSVLLTGCDGSAEQPPEPKPATPSVQPAPTPAAKPAVETDEVALSEEAVDQHKAEQQELESRRQDLQAQLEDSEMLLKMKEEQIRKLEAELSKKQTGK